MENFIVNAPSIALLFFFTIFIGIAFWALNPSAKNKLQALADIPLKEEE